MIIQIIFFLGTFAVVLFGGHFFLYFSAVRFLGIQSSKIQVALFFIATLLSVSFLLSATLNRWANNIFARLYYYFSGFILGMSLYLFILFLAGWLIYFGGNFLGQKPNMIIISIFFLCFAFLYTTYGAWNALRPGVKHIEVELHNLPIQWKGKTIVQLSDVHLGIVHGKKFMDQVVSKVNALKPEMIVITGDLFDGMSSHPEKFVDSLNSLKAVKGTYFVTGNHEIYLGVEKALDTIKKTDTRILNDEIVDIDGLQLIGVMYSDFDTKKDISKIIRAGDNYSFDKPSILLYHAPTNINFSEINSRKSAYWWPDTDFSYAKKMKIGLQLSGHSHKGQMFPFGFLTKYIYSGYDYGLRKEDGFSIYTTSGTGTWGPPIRTSGNSEIVAVTLK